MMNSKVSEVRTYVELVKGSDVESFEVRAQLI